jgi:DNA-directed RNA polymerase II subunit RPB1
MMGLDKKGADPVNMIIEVLAVAPPPVRPSVVMSNSLRSEDDLTIAYTKIIKCNNELRDNILKGQNDTQIKVLRDLLQFYVATIMDNEIKGAGIHKHKSGKAIKAIRARLKGKEGRLRGNLMGKRVDFSARTVITPDPSLKLDQLGVPIEIAMKLTIPEIVTSQNREHLRKLVDRGANNWPGAKYIKRTDGRFIDLSMLPNRTD